MSREAKWIWKAETPASVPGRSADLGREVGQGDQVVADQRGRRREAVAGELYAVARITGESDDDPLFLFGRLGQATDAPRLRLIVGTGRPSRHGQSESRWH